MKCLALVVSCAVVLMGCASAEPVSTDVDVQKMAAIERAAARSGVQVIWLRPPVKASGS